MDIEMPVMDGFTATKEIRKTDTAVPIIAQTAYSVEGIKEKAISSGCNEFFSKPIDPEVLIMKIESYVQLKNENLTH